MIKNNTSSVLAMNLIIFTLGCVLLTQFYSLLFHHSFSTIGWANLLNALMKFNGPHSFQSQMIIFLKNTAPFSNYLFAAGLIITGAACTLLFARFYSCVIVSLFFFLAWILNWNDSGFWPFEFVFPAVFALLAGFSLRRYSVKPQYIFIQLGYSFKMIVVCIILLTLLLYYVTFIAFNNSIIANKIALSSAISFFILNLIPFYITKKQLKKPSLEKDQQGDVGSYLDFMTVMIGGMLILQVYINYFTNIFELNTFRETLIYYAKASHAIWLHPFLKFSADNSIWILPFYVVFESMLSIALTLLLLRGPVLLVASGLLGFLAFAELGASADWPPVAAHLTWQWELLFVTVISFIIAVQRIFVLKKPFTLKKLILGDPISDHSMTVLPAVLISIIAGIFLYLITIAAHAYIGNTYQIIATYSGITFAILIFILLMTNRFRT